MALPAGALNAEILRAGAERAEVTVEQVVRELKMMVKARLYARCGTPMSSTMRSRSRAGITSRILSSMS
jgi:hypothetical protein